MEKEFVSYDLALALKELGFSNVPIGGTHQGSIFYYEDGKLQYDYHPMYSSTAHSGQIDAPLYQQAFRWFREKYSLWHLIEPFKNDSDDIVYAYDIILEQTEEEVLQEKGFSIYEEAELACLRKLIEIVKNNG